MIGVKDKQERLFYQNKAVINSWSVRELRRKINSQLYESSSREEIEKVSKAKLPSTTDPQKVFKDQYDFRPLGLKLTTEKDLEEKIATNIELFLKEMGEDFSFIGRQVPIKIDYKAHHIDLVLYHCGIPCKVLVDLKSGKFDSRDVGQMNKYVNYYRQNRQYEHERDTIGLIICREAGQEEVYFALGGLEEKIFVAEYKVKLPSEEKIKKASREL
ncbi:PDDEXK nuclease domain-containing protein [candidate division CSSED10-310 bacterium]|uniref:PDDEXK nuclease domain-containing protein n=1 Tax=candidate division CSSED10-310 bacterium TaxID=2855610 RepID=A0ABV6Z6U8_UNCC1